MQYKEYGYQSNKATCAHSYLLNDIIGLLNLDKNKKIIDVGCGNGFIASQLIKQGFDVYGIDASEEGINQAKLLNADKFFVQDINSKTLPKELNSIKFDTVISTEVVEHLYAPRDFITFCKSILHKKVVVN